MILFLGQTCSTEAVGIIQQYWFTLPIWLRLSLSTTTLLWMISHSLHNIVVYAFYITGLVIFSSLLLSMINICPTLPNRLLCVQLIFSPHFNFIIILYSTIIVLLVILSTVILCSIVIGISSELLFIRAILSIKLCNFFYYLHTFITTLLVWMLVINFTELLFTIIIFI